MSDQPAQLALFCRGCCGSGAALVDVPNHDGDRVRVPTPCPVCRPNPTLRDTLLAVVRLGKRAARS
jgi:hypothetical protein